LILLGFGSGWIGFSSYPTGYTYFDLATSIGSAYGPCSCPPTAETAQGEFLLLFIPKLVSPGPLMATMLLYPLSFALAGFSLFRWKWMWVAGILSVLSGLLWFLGVDLSQASIVEGLAAWSHSGTGGGGYSAWVQLGAYFALAGGVILLLGYALSRMDKLEWPQD
jgi:hypothetical protein